MDNFFDFLGEQIRQHRLCYEQLKADYTSAVFCRMALQHAALSQPDALEPLEEARAAEEAARLALSRYREQRQELAA